MMRIRTLFNGFIGITVALLVGCGGGGGGGSGGGTTDPYTGATTPAAVTTANVVEVGTTTTEAVSQAVASDSTPFSVAITTDPSAFLSSEQIGDIVRRVRENLPQSDNLPIGVTLTSDELNNEVGFALFCGGSATGPDNMLTADSATLTFNDLCFDPGSGLGQVIMDGVISFNYSETAAGSTEVISYSNFTVTYNGQSHTLNGTETCIEIYSPYSYTCSSTSNYVGSGGLTYQMKDVDVSGNASSGYYVDATVYHPTYGYVTVTTNVGITFNCSNGKPDAGQVSFTGSGSTWGTITFDSCAGYTITYDDGSGVVNSITGTW